MSFKTVGILREGNGVSVLLQEDTMTGLRHVVKEVKGPDPDGYQARQLQAEFELFRKLESPWFLKPVEILRQGKALVYGEAQCTLAQYLARKGKMNPTLVASLLEQCGQALEALHGAGLLHTALGPSSVFIGPDGRLLLGDFRPFAYRGKDPMPDPDPLPRYQAPECNDSAFGPVGPSSDLYSLGYLALEALTGAAYLGLFGPGEQGDTLAWHLDPTKRLLDLRGALPLVPSTLLDVIEAIIPKSPPRRGIKTAKDLLDQLAKRKLVNAQTFPSYLGDKEAGGLLAPPAPPRLLILTPQGFTEGPQVIFVPGKPVLIGNQPGCDWVIRGKGMAIRHAILFCDKDGQWLLFDLRGRGDCHVNDLREPVMPVKKGDILRVGSGAYLVDLGEPVDGSRMLCGVNVGRLLGKTREGKFFLGYSDKRRGPVILQIFPPAFGEDEAWVRRLLQDSSILGRMKNVAILDLHEVGRKVLSDKKVLWYVIRDYSLLGTMSKRIYLGDRVQPGRLTRYTASACKALLEAHEMGVVHGCLHPGTLFFDAADRLRVGFLPLPLDGRIAYRDEAGNPLLGSLVHYRAPELFGTAQPGTLATDVYAIAACMLHYLTGKMPFDPGNPSRQAVLNMKEKELPEFDPGNSDYPAAVTNALFRKALNPDPAKRFRGPAELAIAFRQAFSLQSREQNSPDKPG